ncbi:MULTISPECIES: DUF1631 family protein [unclassified Dyella]|uniref:DUF1631 family protein n=1 Tax=unclassified Dyella TaxID=2634549 RepID=UPI000C84F30E|nr:MULTISPECIES: DUF1631 family protein [unclassified Dyella]MDR3447285.1 DUF1631 family protein [Dyella sp.]PMQ02989.1 hypothetical protein DyAD56_21435 [Dyella sp. AD56]
MEVEQQGRRPPLAPDRELRPDRAGWAPRARRLIEETHALCISWLEMPLRQCLSDAEQRLYALAERSRNPNEQQQCLYSRQLLQQRRGGMERSFMEGVRQYFNGVGAVPEPEATTDAPRRPLELLDTTEHEQTVAVDKLVARGEARHGSSLFELGYRLAVLVGLPPLEGERLPLGPHALATSFRGALTSLELSIEHSLLVLHSFDTVVVHGLSTLYDTVNEHLRADGILPQLRAFPTASRAPQERQPRAADSDTQPAAFNRQPSTATTPAAPGQPRSDSIAVLDSLREMLAQHRTGQGALNNPDGGRTATPEELQLALDALQLHVSDVADHARRELLSAHALREELLGQLNAGRPDGSTHMQLTDEQGDTVELVAMLFEQMDRQLHHQGNAHSLLGDLQLPLLRMAVADQDFFNQREHPARKLLGVVTDAANDWLDGPDGDIDRSLEAKLIQLVDRARREPPSTGLYTSLLADIEHHLGLLNRKAQIAERRQVEAMQGRERLEQARHRAAELMTERFERYNPRGLLRTLLERAWSDVLALTLLRHGEDSEAFTSRLRTTDQLLGQHPVTDRHLLQAEVEAGLQQIGMHAEEAVQVAQRLLGIPAQSPASQETATTTELALKLKQRQRLGEQVSPETAAPTPTPTPAAAATPAPSPAADSPERRIRQRLRQLPFGSWFEFIDPANGRITQRKLAWYSPVSGNSLFVTRRGLRSQEMTLEHLAHEMACGRVREMPPMKESLLDRAWHALTSHLRQITSSQATHSRPGAST